jgi:ATP-dependent HslUV protease ATP-binding subunit HslU
MPMVEMFTPQGTESMGINFRDMFGGMFGGKKSLKRMRISEARRVLLADEEEKLIDRSQVESEALSRVEEAGIVFLDEIDKIAGGEGRSHGPDVSREGVQRDLLPIVEGTTVNTRYGSVRTDHILFIAAGAFHVSRPSDLIPEMQGRFPIRVELQALDASDFERILTEPENSLIRQYTELLATEEVTLEIESDAVRAIAEVAVEINSSTENIGARRLHTVLERLLDEISFTAPERPGEVYKVTAAMVRDQLEPLVSDRDLARYIL